MEELLVGMWHYIVPTEGLPVKMTGELCSLKTFRSQLLRIKERFTVLSPDDLIASIRKEEKLPAKSLMLTFDDGTKDHYRVVLPVLQEMGLKATFFVSTAPLVGKIPSVFKLQLIFGTADRKKVRYDIFPRALQNNNLEEYLENIENRYRFEPREIGEVKWTCNVKLSPEDKDAVVDEMFEEVLGGKEPKLVKEMFLDKSDLLALHRAGMAIGSHGVNHHIMSTLKGADLRKELVDSKRVLQELLGSEVFCLSYPFCFPPENIGAVGMAGYSAAFACNINPPVNRPPYDPFVLRRMHEKDLEREYLS